MSTKPFPEVLTFRQGAEFLQISPRKLEYLVAQGKLEVSRIPSEKGTRGARRFLKSDLYKYLREWKN